jgi:glucokinase
LPPKLVLGIDVGGTKIAAGLVNESAGVISSVTVPTRAAEGYKISLGQVYAAIEKVYQPGVTGIGICAPGPLNPRTGVVLNPPNMPGWHHVPLRELVAQKFGVPVRLENDANAAGLAETLFGAARGCESVLYVTLGTGIGTGIILGGRIYHGKNGAAAEGGHVTVDYRGGPVCKCGSTGCVEALASGTAMAERAQELLADFPATTLRPPVTAEAIGCAANAGDALAVRILDESALVLGAWLGSMISVLDPEIVVIGGGVARIGEPLLGRLRQIVPRRTVNQFAGDTPIVPAQMGDAVGVIGAAAVILAESGI